MNSDNTKAPLPSSSEDREAKLSTAADLARRAESLFHRPVRVFRAPGRVNLIGEHTDYNEGFVLPAAIRFSTWAAAALRPDDKLIVHSENFSECREFSIAHPPAARGNHWSDYVAGLLFAASRQDLKLSGADVLIHGEVPIGSGLSSSAALETVVALALLSVGNLDLDRTRMALLCQRAEREFVGVQVGIMDQFVSAHAQAGNALLLDCRSLRYDLNPLRPGSSLVVCNTMVHHQLAGSAYNQRRQECEDGVRDLSRKLPHVRALRDVTPEQLEEHKTLLSPVVYRRCRHVVSENERVLEAAHALRDDRLPHFGELMYRSHESLRDDYEVSCRELDTMVEIASGLPGVYGARMTGGGFGGCTVNLVADAEVTNFCSQIIERYRAATGLEPAVYVTGAAQGAEEINESSEQSEK
jgi:galactokinase